MDKRPDSKVNMKRWATYSAAGMAALTASADTAEAEITHIVVGSNWTGFDDVYLALAGSAALNFFHYSSGAYVGVFNNGSAFGSVIGFQSNNFNYVSNLASGVNVSTQSPVGVFGTLAVSSGFTNSQFVDTSGYFGFVFDAGAGNQFGWARLTAAGDSPVNSYVIEEYAYGMVGEQIAVGQIASIPEPSSLGLLALGAVGVVATRRKKQQALAS